MPQSCSAAIGPNDSPAAPAAALKRESGPAFKQSVYLLRRRDNLSLREVAEMARVTIGRVAQIQTEIESLPKDEKLERIVASL